MTEPLYLTEATADGGRQGHSRTADGNLDLVLNTPKELGGQGGEGTNPEQLFAAGYAGCFHSALLFAGRRRRIRLPDSSVTAHVGLRLNEAERAMDLLARLTVSVPGVDRATAEELVAEAHRTCPWSRALESGRQVEIEISDPARADA